MPSPDRRRKRINGPIAFRSDGTRGAADDVTPARSGEDAASPLDQLLGKDTQRVDVCRRRDVAARELLGRGIFRRSHPDRLAVDNGHAVRHDWRFNGLRQPQVDDHWLAVLAEKNVRRLEVAMNDTTRMQRLESGAIKVSAMASSASMNGKRSCIYAVMIGRYRVTNPLHRTYCESPERSRRRVTEVVGIRATPCRFISNYIIFSSVRIIARRTP